MARCNAKRIRFEIDSSYISVADPTGGPGKRPLYKATPMYDIYIKYACQYGVPSYEEDPALIAKITDDFENGRVPVAYQKGGPSYIILKDTELTVSGWEILARLMFLVIVDGILFLYLKK